MNQQRLGVIGLGAIGGSVAWKGVRAGYAEVSGFSLAKADAMAAEQLGAVTSIADSPRSLAETSDILVIAAPPQATATLLTEIASVVRHREMVVTDVASVKRPIVAVAQALDLAARFVGSHPLCGTHESGFTGATAHLFDNATVYVVADGAFSESLDQVVAFWKRLDAVPKQVTAAEHDAMVAWTSHLPQATASALAATLARQGPANVSYGSGARDTMRLAGSNLEMWCDTMLANADALRSGLIALGTSVHELVDILDAGDRTALAAWLHAGKTFREGLDR